MIATLSVYASEMTLNIIMMILAFCEGVQSLDYHKNVVKALQKPIYVSLCSCLPTCHSECIKFQANFSLKYILEECHSGTLSYTTKKRNFHYNAYTYKISLGLPLTHFFCLPFSAVFLIFSLHTIAINKYVL